MKWESIKLIGPEPNNGDGTFSYDPNGQFDDLDNGETATDSFTYTVDDGNGGQSTATVTITIAGLNNNIAPVAQDITTHGTSNNAYNAAVSGELAATDADGDALTFSRVPGDTQDGISIYADGQFTVDANVTSFQYLVSDGNGGESIGTVTLTNTVPTASHNEVYIENGSPMSFILDIFDADGDSLLISGISGGFNGDSGASVFTNLDGTVTFAGISSDLAGHSVTYNYQISDGHGGIVDNTLTLHIAEDFYQPLPPPFPPPPATPEGNVPVAEDAEIAVNTDTLSSTGTLSFQLDASDLDGDTLSFEFISENSIMGFGTYGDSLVSISDSGLITIQLTGDIGGDRSLSFDYMVSDGTGRSDTATITLDIGDVPVYAAPPKANDDVFNINLSDLNTSGNLTYFDVLANDTDVNGDALSIISILPQYISELGSYVYPGYDSQAGIGFDMSVSEAQIGQTDTVQVEYTISDGNGGTDTATATFNIYLDAVPPPPPPPPPPSKSEEGDASADSAAAQNIAAFDLSGMMTVEEYVIEVPAAPPPDAALADFGHWETDFDVSSGSSNPFDALGDDMAEAPHADMTAPMQMDWDDTLHIEAWDIAS